MLIFKDINCRSSLGEEEPNVRVDIRSPTNDRQEAGPGSAEAKRGQESECQPVKSENYAGVAQLVEQLICNQQVGGSNPSTSSRFFYAVSACYG